MADLYVTKNDIIAQGGKILSDYLKTNLQCSESNILILDKTIYKFLQILNVNEREDTINHLMKYKDKLPISIEDIIRNPYTNIFSGYTSTFYENYDELSQVIHSTMPLEERRQLSIKLVELNELLLNIEVVFIDWHSKNFMYKDQLKFVDFDSGKLFSKINPKLLPIYIDASRITVLELCLSLVIGFDFEFDFPNQLSIDHQFRLMSAILKRHLDLSKPGILNPEIIIDEVTSIDEEKARIHRKSLSKF